MSVPAARERVGQPFLHDHALVTALKGRSGPVHLIVVQGGATETQAAKQLGSPDATIVPTDFGVYVADEIQKVQIVFLSHCIDQSSIYGRVQTMLNWLDATQEGERLAPESCRSSPSSPAESKRPAARTPTRSAAPVGLTRETPAGKTDDAIGKLRDRRDDVKTDSAQLPLVAQAPALWLARPKHTSRPTTGITILARARSPL